MKFLRFLIIPFLLAACNFQNQDATPTVSIPTEASPAPTAVPTLQLTDTPTPSPSPTATELLEPTEPAEVIVSTPSATPSPLPSDTALPTENPCPWEYTIQANDTLGYIIQQPPFNYRTTDVIREIVAMNDNIGSADILPGPGTVIRIPCPTPTPVPTGMEATQAVAATQGIDPNIGIPADTPVDCHIVQSGDTMVGIVESYETSLEILSRLNRDINWGLCNFELPSGGENCNPILSEGQCVHVPLPTATPTLSPTPNGSETPTRTPTYAAPRVVSPPNGAIVPAIPLTLSWVSVGILAPEEYYLLQVFDRTSGQAPLQDVTRGTSYNLPESMIPADGQAHQIEWSVVVAKPNDQGQFAPIGGSTQFYNFQWQSR